MKIKIKDSAHLTKILRRVKDSDKGAVETKKLLRMLLGAKRRKKS